MSTSMGRPNWQASPSASASSSTTSPRSPSRSRSEGTSFTTRLKYLPIGGAASVRLEPRANRLGVSTNVVVTIDVELQKHQQPVEPLAVLQRVAASVERGADRPRELLKRGRSQWHVGRAA